LKFATRSVERVVELDAETIQRRMDFRDGFHDRLTGMKHIQKLGRNFDYSLGYQHANEHLS